MAIERINFGDTKYSGAEAAIHTARYAMAKELCRGKKILDIACGEGYGSRLLLDWGAKDVLGVDISKEAVENAKKNFGTVGLRYLEVDAKNIKDAVKGELFDLIVSFETFEHIPEPELYLSAIAELRSKSGAIIISCPNDWYTFPDPEDRNEHHARKYTIDEFVEKCTVNLGKPSAIGVGTPCYGWVNLPIGRNGVWRDAKTMNQMLMAQSATAVISPAEDKSLTEKNAYYFWAAWGIEEEKLMSLAALPVSTDTYRVVLMNDDHVSLNLLTKRWNNLSAVPKAIEFVLRRTVRRIRSLMR